MIAPGVSRVGIITSYENNVIYLLTSVVAFANTDSEWEGAKEPIFLMVSERLTSFQLITTSVSGRKRNFFYVLKIKSQKWSYNFKKVDFSEAFSAQLKQN